jgi:6,7-dimethyl-8-ribityllumazine synthase
MIQKVEGSHDADGMRGVVVVARFNEFVTSRLLDGAHGALRHCGAQDATVLQVPGAWEIPLAVDRALSTKRFDFAVALGALIRGQTDHFRVLADQVTRALSTVAHARSAPVGMGVLAVETVEQAIERAGTGSANKGWEAALAAIEMTHLLRQIE